MTRHPADEEVAAYLSGTLPRDEREALEAHLAQCRACRVQVTSARRLLRTRPKATPHLIAAAFAAAAVIAVVLLAPRFTGLPTDPDRAGGNEPGIAQALHAMIPSDGDTVSRGELRFAWRSEPGDPLYRLTITTPRGEAVWSHETSDTTLAPPPDLRLAPGGKYFWFVDALDASGRSLTTGPRTVWIAP